MRSNLPVVERDIVSAEYGKPGTLLKFPMNDRIKDALMGLPRGDRHWSPSQRGWWIDAAHEEYAVRLLLKAYKAVQFIGRDGESDYTMNDKGEIIYQGGLFD